MIRRLAFSAFLALAFFIPQMNPAHSAGPGKWFNHIYVVMMENTNYEDVIGNTADMPYVNSLAQTYGFAANYYGVTHPSMPNYIALTAGDYFGLHKDDVKQRLDATNIVDQLESKGLTWATYQQSIPSVGSLVDQAPATGSGLYTVKHDPFVVFNDIRNNPTRLQNIKPLDALATDLSSGNAPNFAFIVPDQCHDMHGVSPPSAKNYGMPWCGYPPDFTDNHALFQAGDAAIKSIVTTITSSRSWGPDSVIVVTWDENESSSLPIGGPNYGYASGTGCCGSPQGQGGGRVPAIVITSTASHTVSLQPYNHYSLLRTIEDNFGLSCLVNACGPQIQDMTDLIQPAGAAYPLQLTQGFAVTFSSTNPGQGFVLFGPSCNDLVETATRDIFAGSTTHTVLVTGNDLPGTVGDVGLVRGARYYYEVVTLTSKGLEVDNNGGQCYVAYSSNP